MQDAQGRWIGYLVSGLCLALILVILFCALVPGEGVELFFSSFCHQFDDRCYHIQGVGLPVCVRCIWIYSGLMIGHILFIFWNPASRRITQALIGVIIFMILDVFLETLGLYQNWFWTRATTGFLFGLVVSHFTLLGLREIYSEPTNPINYVRSKFISSRTR